jgi:nitrogen fixation protein NifZ
MSDLTSRFYSGSKVRVVRNIRNDGSFKTCDKGDLLVAAGEVGIVRSFGYFLQDQVIYQVYFPEIELVVGVRDSEVIDHSLDWVPCLFRSLDLAQLTVSLKMRGEMVAKSGEIVEVKRVHRDLKTGKLEYLLELNSERIWLDSKTLTLPQNLTHKQEPIRYG